jgi:uncharacterized protein GlcG (DUF336 family)
MDLPAFAKKIADRVEAQSVRTKVPVAVTVIDIHGNVVLKQRMTGAPAFSIELSERPDGNDWVLQEVTARLTGHIDEGDTHFTPELTSLVRRAEAA